MGGGPDQLPNFYHAVLTFERTFRNHKFRGWNIKTTKKRSSTFLGEGKCTPEKILAMRMRKGPPAYVGMGPPGWLIGPCKRPCLFRILAIHDVRKMCVCGTVSLNILTDICMLYKACLTPGYRRTSAAWMIIATRYSRCWTSRRSLTLLK